MVARISNELLSQALLTPQAELSDSDDILLALETARALEAQGEISEAARWLRRAADEAEQQGNDERYLVLARAAADLVNIIGSSPPPPAGDAPTLPPPSPEVFESNRALLEGSGALLESDGALLQAIGAQIEAIGAQIESDGAQLQASDAQATMPPSDAFEPTIAPPASVSAAPTMPPPFPASATISRPSDMPFTERTSMRIGAIRVAILEASIRGARSFFVERLEKGQPPPAGTTEAMLVFTGEAEDEAEQSVNLLAAGDSMMP